MSAFVLTATPARFSVGGSTDRPQYVEERGGASVGMALDIMLRIAAFRTDPPKGEAGIVVVTRVNERVDSIDEVSNPLFRAVMTKTGITDNLEVHAMGELTTRGSGLAGSSAFTVGLLHALWVLSGRLPGAEELAREALKIERDIGHLTGAQDPWTVAFGGIQLYEYHPDGSVGVSAVNLPTDRRREFSDCLLFFETGLARSTDDLLKKQDREVKDNFPVYDQIKNLAYEFGAALEASDFVEAGKIIGREWQEKKRLPGVTSSRLEEHYETAIGAGALGGKLNGAGQDGFWVFAVPQEKRAAVSDAMRKVGLRPKNFDLFAGGSHVEHQNWRTPR